jgi:hypothetical protein
MMKTPLPIQVSPLVAWSLVLLTVSGTFLTWLIGEPIRAALMTQFASQLADETIPPLNILNVTWFGIPIVVSILITVWAYLVTTRRQPVISPGGYY